MSVGFLENALPLILPIGDVVLFPGMFRVAHVSAPAAIRVVDHVVQSPEPLVVLQQRDNGEKDATRAELGNVGVWAQILRVVDMPDGSVRVLLEGMERCRVSVPPREQEGLLVAGVEPVDAVIDDRVTFDAVARELDLRYRDFMVGTGVSQSDHAVMGAHSNEPERLADQVLANLDLTYEERLKGLWMEHPAPRLHYAVEQVATALGQQAVAREVNERMTAAMDKSQREYQLKEQLKAIRTELGDAVGSEAEADTFETRIRESKMPDEVRKEGLKEVARLRRIHSDSAEFTVLRTWLETLCDIPWSVYTDDRKSLKVAKEVLDADHYGLEKVKERVLEYLAVRQLNPDAKSPVLCFVGPPGVGKTSLGKSIATALERKFARVALGGVKDETEVRGHRRTYIGAMAGRIVRTLIRAGSSNPVIVLDELDKVGADHRGDPAAALLEVLDPEQNHSFLDHYVDQPVDLSKVLFIATANLQDPIPAALRDRLEIIDIPGYTEEEKVEIASRFLLPRLMKSHGLKSDQIDVPHPTLVKLVREYTREAGVRNLERRLATVHRKIARKVVEDELEESTVSESVLASMLGPRVFHPELAERVDKPGIGIGLAWTSVGGEILFVEATRMPGKRSLKLTGKLGDVMKESAEAAFSWLRSNAATMGIEPSEFEHEFHLHVPAGAIPKDGPSAGVVMVAALTSLVTGRPFKPGVAMTGEITLRGKVLPIGGVKEKALAARRAGCTTVVLPSHNEADLEDIAPELREELSFLFVEDVADIVDLALLQPQ